MQGKGEARCCEFTRESQFAAAGRRLFGPTNRPGTLHSPSRQSAAKSAFTGRTDVRTADFHDEAAVRPASRCWPLGKVIEHIERHFAQKIVLRDLAEIVDLSIFRFATVFRREVGLPPHRYLCRVRVRHARRLLERGVPPAIAAGETGFCDQSHLARHFKTVCGVTPREYLSRRKQGAATGSQATRE